MIAYLGLGSNLGDRLAHLREAVATLRDLDRSLAVSPVYVTAPVGGPPQDPFFNCVVGLHTDLAPLELLSLAQRLERSAGRVRTVKDGPRTLDADLLLVDDVHIDTPSLTIPHPRLFERGFVLAPLEDLDPSLVPPAWRTTIAGAATLATDVVLLGSLDCS
ncbi:MAG: 2-amino-4-hydroxy-6-hydroxymethyldihydropteridine diphosphokinase [Acidimicrobiales bacterium]